MPYIFAQQKSHAIYVYEIIDKTFKNIVAKNSSIISYFFFFVPSVEVLIYSYISIQYS